MDIIHIISLQLFDLLQSYEEGIKNEMSFGEAKELRKKILHLQSELEQQKMLVIVE